MNYRSNEDLLRAIGRRVLTGTLSLAMTASLVPVAPTYAWAEGEAEQAQGNTEGSADSTVPAEHNANDGGTSNGGDGGSGAGAVSDEQQDEPTTTQEGEAGSGGAAASEGTNANGNESGSGTSGNTSDNANGNANGNGNANATNSNGNATGYGNSNAEANSNANTTLPTAAQPNSLSTPNQAEGTEPVVATDPATPTVTSVKLGSADVKDNNAESSALLTNQKTLTVTATGSNLNLDTTSGSYVEIQGPGETEGTKYALKAESDGSSTYVLNDSVTLGGDGSYTIKVHLATTAEDGETPKTTDWESQSITLDTQAPTASIDFGYEGSSSLSPVDGSMYDASRTAKVTVTDERAIQTNSASLSGLLTGATVSDWTYAEDGKSASAIVTFANGGPYSSLTVSASDGVNSVSDASLTFDSFTVDTVAPSITSATVKGKKGRASDDEETLNFASSGSTGTDTYYVKDGTVSIHVNEANMKSLTASGGTASYDVKNDGNGDYTITLPEGELTQEITLTATDQANHTATVKIPADRLIVDTTEPSIDSVKVSGQEVSESGAKLKSQEFTVTVTDANLLDGNDVALAVTTSPAQTVTVSADGVATTNDGGTKTQTYKFSLPDGNYTSIELTATDKAGNTRTKTLSNVMVDTQAPVFEIHEQTGTTEEDNSTTPLTYEGEGISYYAKSHKVWFTVTEANFTADDIGTYMTVTNNGEKANVTWTKNEDGAFIGVPTSDGTDDGKYHFAISGADPAGNAAVAKDSGKTETDTFIVDKTAPTVEVTDVTAGMRQGASWDDSTDYDYLTYDGENYFNKDTTSVISITEANLLSGTIQIDDQTVSIPEGMSGTWGTTTQVTSSLKVEWKKVDASHYTVTATYTDDGNYNDDHKTPFVTVNDKAGWNATKGDPRVDFVVDETAPSIRFDWGSDPEVKNTQNGRRYYNQTRSVTTTITDGNWDPRQTTTGVIHVEDQDSAEDPQSKSSTTAAEANGSSHDYVFTTDFQDGDYVFWAEARDLSGNHSEDKTTPAFVVDTTAPQVSISFKNNDVSNQKYYGAPRTMTVTVVERNFDPTRFSIDVTTSRSDHNDDPSGDINDPTAWIDNGDTHTFTYTFDKDGAYTVSVSGTDLATNPGKASVDEFVIDQTAPVITMTPKRAGDANYNNVDYYRTPITWNMTITDRNLDVETAMSALQSTATIQNGNASVKAVGDWTVSKTPADGTYTWSTSVLYDELPSDSADLTSYTPQIEAVDLAGNTATENRRPFFVDRTAPSIVMASVDREPSATADPAEGQYQFYNQATRMTINFHDPYLLESAVLYDPDGEYNIEQGVNRGEADGTIVVALVDGTARRHDTEYERNITLAVTDIAGNERIWTIDRQGNVVDDVSSSADNVSLNGRGIYPNRLIQDVTAPLITLSGVEAGTYYNTDQTVHTAVDEFNFAYLQRFDPSRSIVHVVKQEGSAGRAESSWDIPASALAGSGSSWAHDQVFDSDGHYTLTGHFLDYANNESNTSTIGEFTIDKTAPILSVTWDNEDVRNGKYYDATRTATVTVVEHNFDPSLFSITTTGAVGGWSDSGDTHTCTVFFDEGVHNLSISGEDMAHNPAEDFTEPEFVVDTTDPTIELGGVAERLGYTGEGSGYSGVLEDYSAYNGTVAPQIDFADEANFDASSVSYTLTGSKLGDATDSYQHSTTSTGEGEIVQYADLGRNSSDADTAYDVNADDVYVLHASVSDLAGNTVEGDITFSVNRFGSNFLFSVDGVDGLPSEDTLMTEAPEIQVTEINVSGAASEMDHDVAKEYANETTYLARDDSDDNVGYSLVTPEETTYANWAEYLYTVKRGNFGQGSDSDSGDGGQGVYRVNVSSDDTASNPNTTAEYWGSDETRSTAEATKGTVQFTLDQVAPALDELGLPGLVGIVAPGGTYEASFHVTDVITTVDHVTVTVDGQEVPVEGSDDGRGTFTFEIPAKAFAAQDVEIKVSDYAERDATGLDGSRRIYVTNLIPELGIAAALVVAVCGVLYYRRRKAKATRDDGTGSDNPYSV